MADTLDAPWPAFFEQVSGLMEQTYRLNEATQTFLGVQLQQRLEQNRSHMVLQAVALVLVFLLIFTCTRVSTRRPAPPSSTWAR